MIRLHDTLAGDDITFNYLTNWRDAHEAARFVKAHKVLGFDTESTGVNPYKRGWELRLAQIGNATEAYVIPARYASLIAWMMSHKIRWVGHNLTHDIRSIDVHLGYETGVVGSETHIPSHHKDARSRDEGGIGHKLKELSIALVDRDAGKWETELKKEFKKIEIPIPGEVYKSGPRKGQPKVRKAKLAEGWSLISIDNPAYIKYAGADPILTYRVREKLMPVVDEFADLYAFDHEVDLAMDELQRRGMLLNVPYTKQLSRAYLKEATRREDLAAGYGCQNINSTDQVAETLIALGVRLRSKTDTGKWKVTAEILRKIRKESDNSEVKHFITLVLTAKQLHKRRTSYTDAMLRERDINDRVHPSINALGARTSRSSVSSPPYQQLPTKDRAEEMEWESE